MDGRSVESKGEQMNEAREKPGGKDRGRSEMAMVVSFLAAKSGVAEAVRIVANCLPDSPYRRVDHLGISIRRKMRSSMWNAPGRVAEKPGETRSQPPFRKDQARRSARRARTTATKPATAKA